MTEKNYQQKKVERLRDSWDGGEPPSHERNGTTPKHTRTHMHTYKHCMIACLFEGIQAWGSEVQERVCQNEWVGGWVGG